MQCAVHENPDNEAGDVPFLMDVQSDHLADLNTCVVVPLVRRTSFGRPVSRLHPIFVVDGQQVVMATHLLAAVRRRSIGASVVSLADQRDTIIAAIDVLWSGV